jgi:hypothetical protein
MLAMLFFLSSVLCCIVALLDLIIGETQSHHMHSIWV